MATFSEIADRVASSAAEVSRLIREAQLPEPTFNESGAFDFDARKHASVDSEELRLARNALINATQDLRLLTMGPVDYLCSMSWWVLIQSSGAYDFKLTQRGGNAGLRRKSQIWEVLCDWISPGEYLRADPAN